MAITIRLKQKLRPQEEQWLAKNIGPRLHYIHNSIGGQGWVAKRNRPEQSYAYEPEYWTLTLEDDRFATWFSLMFPQ